MKSLPKELQRIHCSCEECIHYQKAHGQHFAFECDAGWYMNADEESANYCFDYKIVRDKKETEPDIRIYIVSNNDHFHCRSDEQHIEKIFRKKEDAEKYKYKLEKETSDSFDILEWTLE